MGRILFLLLAVSLPLAGQERRVSFTDRASAQVLVDTLTRENETLKADAARDRQEVARLISRSTQVRKWINDLNPLLAELKGRNADLARLGETLVDRTLRAQLAAAQTKNKASQKLLEARLNDLASLLTSLADDIEKKTDQVSINEARLGRNTDDIIVLQAAITKTQVQADQLRALTDQVDSLGLRVGTALTETTP